MRTAGFVKKHIISNLPYLLVFWFANKLGEAYRLTEGSDLLYKFSNVIKTLSITIKRPMLSVNLVDLTVGLVGAALIYVVVYSKKKKSAKYRRDVEYGSARWGNAADIKPFTDAKPDNNIILTATESLTMNPRPSNPKYARNKNALIIGGSGSGKTRFVLKPNLMQCISKDYPVSFVVTDPKGEILNSCGKMLQKYGYKIKVFNTVNFAKSHHYNPFSYISNEKDILKMVNALIANTKDKDAKSSEDFWQKSEILLFTALIAYLRYEDVPSEHNFAALTEMIASMETREDDEEFKNIVDILFDDLAATKPDCFAVRQYRKFKLAAAKTAKSILISCGARLACFDIAEIREITRYDELELDKLGDRKTALFLIISDTDDSYNFLVSMCYTQLFNILCEKADDFYGGRLPIHVRCLIDEAANIGQIPKLEKLMATIRSREISACLFLQAQSQLKAIYNDNAETISGNCDSMLFLGGREKTTLEDVSKILGKETVHILNNSETQGQSPSYGKNYNKLGKDLMSMDELAVMDGGKCILQLRGVRPFISSKYDIMRHKNYRYLADSNSKYIFNIDKFLSTKLTVKPDDVFEVYETEIIEDDASNGVPYMPRAPPHFINLQTTYINKMIVVTLIK